MQNIAKILYISTSVHPFRRVKWVNFNFAKRYLFLLISSTAVMLSIFILIKSINSNYGKDVYNNFVLMLRYSSPITIVFFLGMGISVPKFIASSRGKDGLVNVVNTTSVTTLGSVLVLMLLAFLFGDTIDAQLFSYTGFFKVAVCFYIYILFTNYVYAYFRGRELYYQAGLVNIFMRAALPVLGVYLVGGVQKFALFLAIFSFCVFLTVYLKTIEWKFRRPKFDKGIFFYGGKRVFGDISVPLMLAMPVFFISRYVGEDQAVNISLNFMLITGFIALASPLSDMLLPLISRLRSNNEDLIRSDWHNYMVTFVPVVMFCLYHLVPNILLEYVGIETGYYFNLLSVALYFYSSIYLMQPYIDGQSLKQYFSKSAFGTVIMMSIFNYILIYLGIYSFVETLLFSLFVLYVLMHLGYWKKE